MIFKQSWNLNFVATLEKSEKNVELIIVILKLTTKIRKKNLAKLHFIQEESG